MSEPRKRRRGRNEGSIFFDDSRKRWVAQISFLDSSGKRIRRSVTGRTKKDVQGRLDELRKKQSITAGPMTLQAYLDEYSQRRRREVAPETCRGEEGLFRRQVVPYLGSLKIADIEPIHISQWFNRMSADKVSADRQRKAATALGTAMKAAVRLKLIAQNPVSDVPRPRVEKPEVEILTAEQAQQLINGSYLDHFHALYIVSLTTGCRPGEAFALAWSDIDFDRGTISITKSLEETDGQLRIKTTKNRSSRRTVLVPATTIEAMREHREQMAAEGLYFDDLVFPTPRGGMIRKSNLHRRYFKPLLARLGLPDVTFHALRHTHASLLIAAGENAKVIQHRLGHSSITTTLDVYGHLFEDAQASAAEAMESLFGPKHDPAG